MVVVPLKWIFNAISSFNYFWNTKIFRFNGVCSRDNLTETKDGAYVLNLDEYSDIGAQWFALYVYNDDVTYFDSFDVEHIPKGIKTFMDNKNITTSIFKIQAYDSMMCRYF